MRYTVWYNPELDEIVWLATGDKPYEEYVYLGWFKHIGELWP